MKTLRDYTIIYDDECPMCDLYTAAFIKTGMLDARGRNAYSKLTDRQKQTLDMRRACDEIALINNTTGEVTYGMTSLSIIAGHQLPMLKYLLANQYVARTLQGIYAFVSYNRKVIIPGKQFEAENKCTPSFRPGYRWAYIVFCWLITSLILNQYASLLRPLLPGGSIYRELIICGGQIIFQGAIISRWNKTRWLHYLGNMMTVSLAGALLLLPALMLSYYGFTNPFFYLGWFMVVVLLMLLEHYRRVKILGIHPAATATWIAYRIAVLLIIFML